MSIRRFQLPFYKPLPMSLNQKNRDREIEDARIRDSGPESTVARTLIAVRRNRSSGIWFAWKMKRTGCTFREAQVTIRWIAWLALSVAPVLGQWLNYPTPGIPRLANGQPNLSAPVPRAHDGKPDLSGIWEHKNARTTAYYLDKVVIPWRPEAEALFKQNQANNQKDNPEGQCLPRGLPKSDAFDLHKIVQTPGLIVVLYEYNTMYRQIFTDGRPLPGRSQSQLDGLLDGPLERRLTGSGVERLQRQSLAFVRRQPHHRCNAFDRTNTPPRLRAHGH